MSNPATGEVVEYEGCTIDFTLRGNGNWPVIGSGLTGLDFTGEIRRTADSPDVLLSLTGSHLSLVDQDLRVACSDEECTALGPGVFSLAIRGRDADGWVTAVAVMKIRILPIADKTP